MSNSLFENPSLGVNSAKENPQTDSWEDAEDYQPLHEGLDMSPTNQKTLKQVQNQKQVPSIPADSALSSSSEELPVKSGSAASCVGADADASEQAKSIHRNRKSSMFIMFEGSDKRFKVLDAREELKKRMAQINLNKVLRIRL